MSYQRSAASLVTAVARVAIAGVLVSVIVVAGGHGLERARMGASDAEALTRVEAELRQRFDAAADTLRVLAGRIGGAHALIEAAAADPVNAGPLFTLVSESLSDAAVGATGLTIYGPAGSPLAWGGRVSDVPSARVAGPASLFLAPGTLGPRLVLVEPVRAEGGGASNHLGSIVVEQSFGDASAAAPLSDTFLLSTAVVPVALRTRLSGTPLTTPYTFTIEASSGQALVEADVSPQDLAAARVRWRLGSRGLALGALAVTLLICLGPMIDARRRMRTRAAVWSTFGIAGVLVIAWSLVKAAAASLPSGLPSARLAVAATGALAAAWLILDLAEWRRRSRPPMARGPKSPGVALALCTHALAGAVVAFVLIRYERYIGTVVSGSTLDVLDFSLHPFDPARLATIGALVLLHAGILGGLVALSMAAAAVIRTPRMPAVRALEVGGWAVGAAVSLWLGNRGVSQPPLPSVGAALVAVAICAWLLGRLRPRLRQASQAARLLALFMALLVPALAMYPSLAAFSTQTTEDLIAREYGPQAASLRDALQQRLQSGLAAIDSLPSLEAFVLDPPIGAAPTTERAFEVWSKTDLARFRVTSAVELFGPDGRLASRFALSLPESGSGGLSTVSCTAWDAVEEVSPFGSTDRHVLRASRGICRRGERLGAIVVRAMLDYRTLPFTSTQSPYLESLSPARTRPAEGARGRDVEFAVYGWSRAPLYVSGPSVWPMPDGVFARMVASRDPTWDTVTRGGERFRVYFLNDRGGIYALGYPMLTAFGHAVNLAELAALCGVLFALLLTGATLLNALASRRARARALLREVRSSFYRRLFLAFVAVSVVPVIILALATRAYFATQFEAEVEDAAVQTATVAQRLVEDYATLEQRDATGVAILDDQIMVLVSRAIDQSVNLFDRDRLQATSERDLFASGLLPARTPGDVYRSILLDRRPTFVGREEVGGVSYLLAAAPVRASGREGIVTVPQTLRQSEIERRIDELDRRILFAAVVFVLLGAALGYWMAERIADPVNRLTRATRRIARGDLTARVAATSADELGQLVEDFNHMAADLTRQRQELERSQRLEAWAEMARQVAHDIKNPLTPIQLSAEHARRVNLDKGRPLSPVLDDCVSAILNQVRLLRQISAEFSSFASSPVARPERLHLPELIGEVVEPYRTALSGRIVVDVLAADALPPVRIDRTLFSRALTNVIENALHAMPGEGRLTIDIVDDSGTPPRVRVTVADTGVGMDQDALAKIFEPYFSTKATGTGLGLTIAKRNIELNGGTIAVSSHRGVGTTVTITLPVDPAWTES